MSQQKTQGSFMQDATSEFDAADANAVQLVTVYVSEQLFGLPILQVRDVFMVSSVTPVPLAASSVAGLFNLRGRVMTMLSMRALLGQPRDTAKPETTAIGIEWKGESYGLLVDRVGEVMTLSAANREFNPVNLDPRWASLSAGVHRLEGKLLVEFCLNSLFNGQQQKAA
jgi:purine-binding chemotaxis protein CheW